MFDVVSLANDGDGYTLCKSLRSYSVDATSEAALVPDVLSGIVIESGIVKVILSSSYSGGS